MASNSLTLHALSLPVFLGVYPEEKLHKQSVSIDVRVRFLQPLAACDSDQLADTYCYDKMIAYLKAALAEQKFQLIEHLTKTLYGLIKHYFPPDTLLAVRVTKQPPIPELSRGVTFEYSDEPCPWSF